MKQMINVNAELSPGNGWYISGKDISTNTTNYLHSDGQWRSTTMNDKEEYTGIYQSKGEAEQVRRSFGF